MRVAAFSIKPYDRASLSAAAAGTPIEWSWFEPRLDPVTARLAEGAVAVNCFVNDQLDAAALEILADRGVKLITLRCAGFNQVDLAAAARLSLPIVRVPEYSPHAVAEHTIGLVLTLDRRLHKAYNRVRDGNFSLEGLLGFDLHGRTAGVIGTGRIGRRVAEILLGFGCRVLAHDPAPEPALAARGVAFVPLEELLAASDIVTLHCPLRPARPRDRPAGGQGGRPRENVVIHHAVFHEGQHVDESTPAAAVARVAVVAGLHTEAVDRPVGE